MNYNIDDMKLELVEIGDYMEVEVENMEAHEILSAWLALPCVVAP